MILQLACLIAGAAAASINTYDQRQDGDFNVRADVQNVMFLIAIPRETHIPAGLLGLLKRKNKHDPELEDRSDNVMEAFVEPGKPYQVEIASSSGGEGREVEVVIAGRRRLENEQPEQEYKLIGALEQCGPEKERDPVNLTCRLRSQPAEPPAAEADVTEAAPTPEVVQVSS